MINEKCTACLFNDSCRTYKECNYYIPANDEAEEAEIDEYIEEERRKFREEWHEYINEESNE